MEKINHDNFHLTNIYELSYDESKQISAGGGAWYNFWKSVGCTVRSAHDSYVDSWKDREVNEPRSSDPLM